MFLLVVRFFFVIGSQSHAMNQQSNLGRENYVFMLKLKIL